MNTKEQIEEEEANYFALCLLMPKEVFIKAYNMLKWDLSDNNNNVSVLAKAFGVSESAVVSRISSLKL